jgi:hypothetical protein
MAISQHALLMISAPILIHRISPNSLERGSTVARTLINMDEEREVQVRREAHNTSVSLPLK